MRDEPKTEQAALTAFEQMHQHVPVDLARLLDEPGPVVTTGLGEQVEARLRRRRRFVEAERVASLGGDHLWTAMATFLVDPAVLPSASEQQLLNAAHLAEVFVSCYRCGEGYDERLLRRRCRGRR